MAISIKKLSLVNFESDLLESPTLQPVVKIGRIRAAKIMKARIKLEKVTSTPKGTLIIF